MVWKEEGEPQTYKMGTFLLHTEAGEGKTFLGQCKYIEYFTVVKLLNRFKFCIICSVSKNRDCSKFLTIIYLTLILHRLVISILYYLFLDYIYAVTVLANKGHLQTTSIGFCGFLNPLFPKYITYAYLVSLSFG